ncbi:MAG: adenine deaminase [Pseudobutyrivibrio sp.]|nr:adenine deaminase [Pseudobutyrivibrio sp.]
MRYQQKNMTRDEYEHFLKVASGDEKAELVLKNATFLDVFTNHFKSGDIAISKGTFAGIGKYSGIEEIDMTGKTIVPGFIDAHIHIESTTVVPEIFVRESIKHGTTAVITDPHEIANVMGVDGINYMLEATEGLPMDIFFMIPSCVPSCKYDESGAVISAKDMEQFYGRDRVKGMAELMDVLGVVERVPEVLDKSFSAIKNEMLIDGHAPMVTGQQLVSYAAAGVLSDHECATLEEALEKMGLGVWIMIREGTAAQNLADLIGLCQEPYASRSMFCTDDRHINHIIDEGHIDAIIRKAIRLGVDPAIAYKMASYNAAAYFDLRDRGAISPGFLADFIVIDNINDVTVGAVYKNGIEITEEALKEKCKSHISDDLVEKSHNTFHMPFVTEEMLINKGKLPIIGLVPGQLYTTREGLSDRIDIDQDILKVAVVERHKNTGHIGLGFVTGYGMKKGAIATSVAHDAHNIIAIGTSEKEIAIAINELKNIGGGMVVYADGKIKASYSLPVAGLMSEEGAIEAKKHLEEVHSAAYELGANKDIDPFMTLSFTALPVIPELRITTKGVVDVASGKIFK